MIQMSESIRQPYTTMPERMTSMETQMCQVISILNQINAKMDDSTIDNRLKKVEGTNRILVWGFSISMLIVVAVSGSVGSEYMKRKLFNTQEVNACQQIEMK